MTSPGPAAPPRISRAPVIVVGGFFIIAVTLVLIGAQRSLDPAPDVVVMQPGTPDAPRVLTVIMRDYRFDPTPIVLVPGETVRLTVFNGGLVEHELSLGDAGMQEAWARADAAATPPVPFATAPSASVPPGTGGLRLLLTSGERLTVEHVVPATGELLLLCNLPGHVQRGMVGAVELRATLSPAGASGSSGDPGAATSG